MSLPRFLWAYFRPYGAWAALAAAMILVFALSTALLVALIEPIFGEVLLAQGRDVPAVTEVSAQPAGEEGGWLESLEQRLDVEERLEDGYLALKERLGVDASSVVYFVPALFLVIFLVRSLADFLSGYAFQHIGLGMTTRVRNDLYGKLLHQSSRYHSDHPSGELLARIINDVALMQNAVSHRLLDLVQQSVVLLALLAVILTTHLRLALVCLVVTPFLIYPIVRFGSGMRRTSHRSQERMAELASLVAEGIRGHRVVKAFNMEDFELERFRQATRRHLRVNLWAQMLSHLSSPVVESLAVLAASIFLVYAGRSIRAGELTPPELVKFLTALMMMYDPVRKLNKVNLILQEALAAAQRVSRQLAARLDIEERPGARSLTGIQEGLRFEGVTFAYEERPVLKQVSLDVPRGEVVALVGPSGAGKTTLVHLLPRFFDPDEGRVLIDGVDLRDLTLRSLRGLIGIVSQDTVLFNDSVRDNIAYGRLDLGLDEVREAAAAAYADDFIMQLPKGYETVIGEGGVRLSGGQRQRLAIARALLKNPPILILDEATSQLDSESESLVQKALSNLMQGRTTLVIAHRLSTVVRADRIVVMEGGRVVEEGSHRQLLELGGTYRRLYDLQFRA